MNRKIWKALGIAVCMLALAAPRAMAETHVHMVTAQTNLVTLFETINNTVDNDEHVIELYDDITLESNYILTNGKTTTIKGEDRKIFINGSNDPKAGITVIGKGTVLNLGVNGYDKKLTIDRDPRDDSVPENPRVAFVSVLKGATANMYEHVTLQNGKFAGNACVVIMGSDSAFNMYGGVIENCSRAVTAGSKATFNMSMPGGEILNCGSENDDGGVLVSNATFVMSGGTISGCSAGAGGGLYATNQSTIIISGGTISGCTAANTGGGLYAYDSTINISGGTIKGNEAAYGGGVALIGSTINPIINWTVVGNKAYKTESGNDGVGGGIKLENGSMDVSDGSNRIYNNTADGHGADICLEKGASITLPDAAGMGATYLKSGINIDGWYNDNPRYTPSESGQAEKKLQLSGPLSLVASYTVIPVRIVIDTNGGAGGSGSQTVHKGTTVTLEAPTKEGHLFKGWEDKEKGNSYPAGEDGKVHITATGDMTLTAVWEARSFTVTYVLLNGETRTKTVNYGQTVTLVEEPRTGYTFVGWKDGEKVYRAGETITVTGDMTLTAVWKARTFTVTYVLLNGKTRAETVNYGQTVTLGEEPRTGYTFVGWNDGEKMYHAGETITVTGDMTLTAEWKKLPSAENLPKTGDESPVLLWGAALAVSAAACFVLRRKK